MKKYGILLTAEEHKRLKTLAAEREMAMQDIARDAVLAAMSGQPTATPAATPVSSALQAAHTLVKQLDILESRTRDLAREVQDAASYIRGLMNATDDARSAPRSERMEAAVLPTVGKALESARGATKRPTEGDRGTARDDPRTTGPQRVTPRRRSS